MQTFISLWNKEDTTSLVNDGIRWVFSNYIYSSNYFKLKLDSYGSENHNRDCYEIIYTNETWSKIRRIITTNSDDNNKELVNIEGDLTVAGTVKNTVTSTNWTSGYIFQPLEGIILVRGVSDDISFAFYSGSTYRKGGSLYLRSINRGTDISGIDISGTFALEASNRDGNNSLLEGFPNGTLRWNNTNLAEAAIVSKSLGENGYIKYASGLIVQWGVKLVESGVTNTYLAFPISFINECVTCTGSEATDDIPNENGLLVWFYSKNGCQLKTQKPGVYVHWLAIGY